MAGRGVSVFFCLAALFQVAVIDGFQPRGMIPGGVPTPEDCMRPPMKRIGRECCSAPKERIWGDLKASMNLCFKRFKNSMQETEIMRQEAAPGESAIPGSEGSEDTATDDPNGPSSTTPSYPNHRKRPYWKKHHLRRHPNDSCFMECVFEDQGFLVNKILNKEALLTRLSDSLGGNEPWHKAAVAAFESCYSGLQVPTNGTCQSGSEEIFRCTFKQLFFNCPNWSQTEYCTSLKEFYQKCPDGPPPEVTDSHNTTPASEEGAEASPTTEANTHQP